MTAWTGAVVEAWSVVGMAALGATALVLVLLRHVRRRYVVVVVDGESMAPAYAPGDRVLVRRESRAPARGDVVVVRKPDVTYGWPAAPDGPGPGAPSGRRWLLKRVAATGGDPWPDVVGQAARGSGGETVPSGHVVLLSDNPRGSDSRRWGPCPEHQVLGRVARRMSYRWASRPAQSR
ncbi:S26 family signal peptidase [Promicromonospora sp. NPDC059942]|uniref:S26 family signal peptidase n=1 Tax=Promicromonospora sp. NPDC059942 TaxID=3347009 RepID=UPI00364757B1